MSKLTLQDAAAVREALNELSAADAAKAREAVEATERRHREAVKARYAEMQAELVELDAELRESQKVIDAAEALKLTREKTALRWNHLNSRMNEFRRQNSL